MSISDINKKMPDALCSHRASGWDIRVSSSLNTHFAQLFGAELGLAPVPAEECQQTKADQDCEDYHGKLLSYVDLTQRDDKRCAFFQVTLVIVRRMYVRR